MYSFYPAFSHFYNVQCICYMHLQDILSTNLSPTLRHRSPLSVGSLSADNFIRSALQTGILRKLLWVLDGLKEAYYRLYLVNVARYIYENLLQKVRNTKLSADIHVSP